MLTTNPADPRLGHGIDTVAVPQHQVYLVLSEAERAKGFLRPYRASYIHVGIRPRWPTRSLTAEEVARYGNNVEYVLYEPFPASEAPMLGRAWKKSELTSGCDSMTSMGRALAETYARDPHFYGATYCAHCEKHLPVGEFIWADQSGERVGS